MSNIYDGLSAKEIAELESFRNSSITKPIERSRPKPYAPEPKPYADDHLETSRAKNREKESEAPEPLFEHELRPPVVTVKNPYKKNHNHNWPARGPMGEE